ncbi:TolC family protein [Formosa sediminum]|uniref:TolC family protein n=1 Tax=Formosa sediminum TaxID=2594004 RepID=A0A516GV21_9FLAO|nr:TolC family protein [Formosa sediminum]QDO95240.1 TolC family protein [Formosa sediminum]
MNRILLLFLITLNITSLFSQNNEIEAIIQFKSFQEVLDYADENSIIIQSAIINEQVASVRKKDAKSFLYPSVKAATSYNNNITLQPTLVPAEIFNPDAPEGSFEELTFGEQHIYSAGIQAQWNILNFQQLFASQTANILAKQSTLNTQKTKFNTYNVLASTYYSILLTQEAITIYKENLIVSEAIYSNTKEKFKNGIVSEEALNTAEIKQLENKKRLNQATSNLSRFYTQLQSQLNTSQKITISDAPENFNLINNNLQTVHPEISWQEMEVDKNKSSLKEKKALLLPNISFNYQYNYSWATDDFTDFSDANELPQQYLGVQLNIPVFNGLSYRQKIKQSQLELQQQELQLKTTKLEKQKEDELLLLDIKQYAEELTDNQNILELMQKNDVHAENQYQSGIISLDNRLDTYEDLLKAQDNYLQSLAAFTLSEYKIYIRQIDFTSKN